MEKPKRWQFFLIFVVLILTLYNILPTIIYYSKPLKKPISEQQATDIAQNISNRVNALEQESKNWLTSFSRLIGVRPEAILFNENNPHIFEVRFTNVRDAELFKKFLNPAGQRIPFVPAQLSTSLTTTQDPKIVLVQRQIPIHIKPEEVAKLFQFTPKYAEENTISPLWKQITEEQAHQLLLAIGGTSPTATLLTTLASYPPESQENSSIIISLAKKLNTVETTLGLNDQVAIRILASFAQSAEKSADELLSFFTTRAKAVQTSLVQMQQQGLQAQKQREERGELANTKEEKLLQTYANQIKAIEQALALIETNRNLFTHPQTALTSSTAEALLKKSAATINPKDQLQQIPLNGTNPYIQSITIDWGSNQISFNLFEEFEPKALQQLKGSESAALKREKFHQLLIAEIARIGRVTDEEILPYESSYAINLSSLTNPTGFLAVDLSYLAKKQSEQLIRQLKGEWNPTETNLIRDNYPILTYSQFTALPQEEQKLGLIFLAPVIDKTDEAFNPDSLYIIAKGMNTLLEKAKKTPESKELFLSDFISLNQMMQVNGFIGYPGSSPGVPPAFKNDFIYELENYYSPVLKATRENFQAKGNKKYATLDFSNLEQRIVTENKIDDNMQEDLLKWKEEYSQAQVDIDTTKRFLTPAPTKNPFWNNFKLSATKYFRGDENRIIQWGLDLSGGKTVRIGLRDQNNRTVTNPDDLNQAVNELYNRINKMGVSERTIRIENENVILEFPGSQALSASELIEASAMYFHIINEKFSIYNAELRSAVQQFLQDVWNEAVVTNRKDLNSINIIAWQQLGGDLSHPGELRPQTESAELLYKNGLRLAPPNATKSDAFNDTLSSIGILRGDQPSEWEGKPNPLVIHFHNYALEGSSLTNVQVGYDPSKGNTLTFSVNSAYSDAQRDHAGSPRDALHSWTSQFAQTKIQGTPKGAISNERGWRMAVILNGTIISNPALSDALRDGGTITGRFTQREVNQLAADLKAGSLSYTPHILSEENVSPELGQQERTKGIAASIIALILVFALMSGYYRFAGIVASCAVFFNILIMWGVLQNINAALTLPGIAGIILTIGMAVDANVLVFERIREEFKISGKIGSAIQAGYQKAFSAIIDSNVTTIIAALILIQSDSGPIKGFAITLTIGIVSSMFTALFMTRTFFAYWVQNPKHKELKMSNLIGSTKVNFLGQSSKACALSVVVIALGSVLFFSQGKTILGMDFTGGYALHVELETQADDINYRQKATEALLAAGATSNDFTIRQLSHSNDLKIQLGMSMEEKDHPFYQLPETLSQGTFSYEYLKSPRLTWVVDALAKGGLTIQKTELNKLHNNWTVMSGQFSDAMRDSALIALGFALVSILVYITLRFEWKYALASVIGLAHDVLITLGIVAFFHWLGFPVQIDLEVIGAIMTIIGYSLNDTIIVFDRIREDIKLMRKSSYKDVVNHAINITLGRTIMTSGTTLVVLLALVILGGNAIFGFALVMTIGVMVGTLSSLYLAPLVLIFLHQREQNQLVKTT